MKTEQEMVRVLDGFEIRQRHKTAYLSMSDLVAVGSARRAEEGLPARNPQSYFQREETKAFMASVSIETGIPVDELKHVKRGRGGETFLHPLVFIDMAMWYSPKFRVRVIQWFYDSLLFHRDSSGDSFRAAMSALESRFPHLFDDRSEYARVSNYIAACCGISDRDQFRWNRASERQLRKRDLIHNNIVLLSGYIDDMTRLLNEASRKAEEHLMLSA